MAVCSRRDAEADKLAITSLAITSLAITSHSTAIRQLTPEIHVQSFDFEPAAEIHVALSTVNSVWSQPVLDV